MPVIRVEKNKNYTVMSNYHLQDKNISLKAKGLLSYMLSLPEYWEYSIAGLSSICKEGPDSIRTAICELEDNGYITRSRERSEDGKLGGAEYIVREFPENYETIEPTLENPMQETSMQETTGQINTKETKDVLKKERTKNISIKAKRFVPPTVEEVAEYAREKGYTAVDPEAFINFYAAKGWMMGKNKMQSWRHAVAGWNYRGKERGQTTSPGMGQRKDSGRWDNLKGIDLD